MKIVILRREDSYLSDIASVRVWTNDRCLLTDSAFEADAPTAESGQKVRFISTSPALVKLPLSRGKVVSYVLTKIARFAKNIPNDAALQAWCLACLNFLVSTSWLPDKFPQSSHLQSLIASASFVTMNNSVLWTEKLLVHSPWVCATHIFWFPGIEIIFVPNGKGNLWRR